MTDARWLDAEEQRTWRRFVAVMELLPGALDAPLQRDAGLNGFSYQVLAMLSEAPGRVLRMSDLAAVTNASLSRLSHVVRRLESLGWVERRAAADDGRATEAILTAEGWDQVRAAAPVHVRAVRQLVIDRLTAEQVEQLDGICRTILDGLPCDSRRTVYRAS